MEQKQRLFIYDRREVIVLILLGLTVAGFAFTLGVHLGKRVLPKTTAETAAIESPEVPTLQDSVPNKQELSEQSKGVQSTGDEEMSQTLHDEVAKSGLKLKDSRQTQLPDEAKSQNAGATTLKNKAARDEERSVSSKALREAGNEDSNNESAHDSRALHESAKAPTGHYTLQVGSYPSEEEAKAEVDSLKSIGLKPFLRTAQVKGMGTRFRLFIGGYPSRDAAEKAGSRYQEAHLIHSFLVSNLGQ